MGITICLLGLGYQWVPKLGRNVLYDILRILATGVCEELAGCRSRLPTGEGLEQDCNQPKRKQSSLTDKTTQRRANHSFCPLMLETKTR